MKPPPGNLPQIGLYRSGEAALGEPGPPQPSAQLPGAAQERGSWGSLGSWGGPVAGKQNVHVSSLRIAALGWGHAEGLLATSPAVLLGKRGISPALMNGLGKSLQFVLCERDPSFKG